MKKSFYYTCSAWLVAPLLAATTAAAQSVPNNTLDTWAVRAGIEAPAGWLTTDDYLSIVNSSPRTNTGTVLKSSDAHSSPYAANLTNVAIGNYGFSGSLFLGSRFDYNLLGGLPYTTRPAQMQFYYKYNGPASDSAFASVILTRTTSTGPLLVGQGATLLAPTTSGYVQMSVPITYGSSGSPDSIRIYFDSCIARRITIGASLLIDDITLSNPALATRADAEFQAQLTVSPNPSPAGRFRLNAPDQPALASAPYAVLDLTGRVVAQQPALAVPSPVRDIDLSNLSTGIYLLQVDSKQGKLVRQLVVK
ncbi:hypothetical protein GCM10027422_47780 [Hymenobacter arcticus]